jgi:hypothetical protein
MQPGLMGRWGFAPIMHNSNLISKPGSLSEATKRGPASPAIRTELSLNYRTCKLASIF